MKKDLAVEISFFFITLAILVFNLWSFLTGKTSFLHDNLYWEVPVFHYFAESLLNGYLPLWNPYEHGGEPFYPILGVPRLFDPTDPLTVWIGGHFTHNLLLLTHWARFAKIIITLLGAYFCIRPWVKSLPGRVAFFPILFLSYYAIGSFRQQAHIALFAGIPWVLFYFQRIIFFDDKRLFNWLALGAFLGLNWQFYHFAPIWTLFLFIGIGLFSFYREGLKRLWDKRLALTAGICFAMMGPSIFLYFTQDRYVFPARMLPKDYQTRTPLRSPDNNEGGAESIVSGVRIPYAAAYYSGTVGNTEFLLQPLIPDTAYFVDQTLSVKWRFYADCSAYIGVLTWALALLGLFLDRANPACRVWGTCLFGMGLLLLGKGGAIHQLFYGIYPPISAIRHTRMLMPVALFPLLLLAARGWEVGRLSLFPSVKSMFGALGLGGALIFTMREMNQDWAWIILIPMGVIFYVVFRKDSGTDKFWAVLLGTGVAAGVMAPNHLIYFILAQISLVLFLGWQWRKLSPWFLVFFLFFDYHHHLKMNRPLYGTRASPVEHMGIPLDAQKPVFPETRVPYVSDWISDPQSIRYLSVISRIPTAFSTPFAHPKEIDTFEKALKAERWSTFLLPRTYFDLIHSPVSVEKMAKAFAIGSSTLKFNGPKGNKWSREVLDYNPNHLTVRVKTEQDGNLFWSDGYAPEWRATVDGKAIPVQLALGHFKAVAVPAGEHTIEFKFVPVFYLLSLALFYLVFFGSLLWVPFFAFVKGFSTVRLPEPVPA